MKLGIKIKKYTTVRGELVEGYERFQNLYVRMVRQAHHERGECGLLWNY